MFTAGFFVFTAEIQSFTASFLILPSDFRLLPPTGHYSDNLQLTAGDNNTAGLKCYGFAN